MSQIAVPAMTKIDIQALTFCTLFPILITSFSHLVSAAALALACGEGLRRCGCFCVMLDECELLEPQSIASRRPSTPAWIGSVFAGGRQSVFCGCIPPGALVRFIIFAAFAGVGLREVRVSFSEIFGVIYTSR
jgi:hypothetical protein